MGTHDNRRGFRLRPLSVLLLCSTAGCTAVLGSDPNGSKTELDDAEGNLTDQVGGESPTDDNLFQADPEVCAQEARPGASPIRRLSRFEYNRTLADLTGDTSNPADAFPEEGGSGFDNNADVATVSRLLAGKYLDAAEATTASHASDLLSSLGCEPVSTACISDAITTFGQRAYRRPLSEQEVQAKVAFFQDSVTRFGEEPAGRMLIESFLQSPHYLYRVELTGVGANEPEMVAPYEMASRLSYFLWGTAPDDLLLEEARSGRLSTKEQVRTQAVRMLADERATAVLSHFHGQWMGFDDVESIEKDPGTFPEFDANIASLMKTEAQLFVTDLVRGPIGTFDELMTSHSTFANASLAGFYGISGPQGADFEKVELSDRPRAGILTQGAVVAAHSKATETGVIHRGLFVREQLFCQIPPPPPDGVETELPPPSPEMTMRERVTAHRADPACATCHELLDPIGFGFEHYDAVGRYRTEDEGLPIDATGDLVGTDSDGSFDGVAELGQIAAESGTAHQCYVKQWFRFANGRTESGDDDCSLTGASESFQAAGRSITELVLELTQTDAFLYRKTEGNQAP